LQRYPDSGYLPQAYFWLGSTYFAKQECDKAIPAYQTVAARFPTSQKAPEALLNIASCQLDLKDKAAARETLDHLLKKYPSSSAASMGKERLTELK
jgi:tol-pal system protein YbgF